MYKFKYTSTFITSRSKVLGNDTKLKKRLKKVLMKLAMNPGDKSLRSHKVNTRKHGGRWSSWITGDIRIIWDYDTSGRMILLLLDIGSHSGSKKVYK